MMQRHALSATPATSHALAAGVVFLATALGLTGCADDPGAFLQRFEAAVASGEPARVRPLLTRASRPIFDTLIAAQRADGAPADGPFDPRPMKQPTRLVDSRPMRGGVVVTVQADGQRSEWVLLEEGGQLRLDLLGTSDRRGWLFQ